MKYLDTTRKQAVAGIIAGLLVVGASGGLLVANQGNTAAPSPTVAPTVVPTPGESPSPTPVAKPLKKAEFKALVNKLRVLVSRGSFEAATRLIDKTENQTNCSIDAFASLNKTEFDGNMVGYLAYATGIKDKAIVTGKLSKKMEREIEKSSGQDYNGIKVFVFVAEVCA